MPTTLPVYYAGPGKIYFRSPGNGTPVIVGMQPADANGQIKCSVNVETATRGAAQYGELFETLNDITGTLETTPFDNWSLLPFLFPTFLGVTTGAATYGGTGLLAVGTSPHDPTNAGTAYPGGVWTSDGREYNFNRVAVTKHPTLKLCPGEKLFGSVELSALGTLVIGGGTTAALPGAEGFLMSNVEGTVIGNPISETAPASGAIGSGPSSDPDTTGFTISDFSQVSWLGAYGAVAGMQNMEGESGWDLVPDIKYNTYKVQKLSRIMKLSSARFGLKSRLVGPGHTTLLKYITGTSGVGGLTLGGILTQAAPLNLVLTGSNGKTITLVNCTPKMAPFEFGGTALNTGEVMWVTETTVTSGNPNVGSAVGAVPCLQFSA